MSNQDNQLSFTSANVDQWLAEGLVTGEQAAHIRERISVPESTTLPASARLVTKPLDVITIAYYFGGFLTLFAFTYFIVMNWASFGEIGQFLISIFSVVAIAGAGLLLRRTGLVLGGNMLIFVATGIVSWAAYNFARMVGIWPPAPSAFGSYAAYEAYQLMLRPLWVGLEVISVVVAVAAIWLTRFPPIAFVIVFWSWYLALDVTRLFAQSTLAGYGNLEQAVTIIYGVGLLAVGVFLQRRTSQDYCDWFYVVGHLAIFINATMLILNTDVVVGLIFLPLYFVFLVASVWLQQRIFLVFGAVSFHFYILYLVYKTFYSSANFALILALVGVMIILSTAFYQRYVHPWLKTHLNQYGMLA